jgi:hypothetical protein
MGVLLVQCQIFTHVRRNLVWLKPDERVDPGFLELESGRQS